MKTLKYEDHLNENVLAAAVATAAAINIARSLVRRRKAMKELLADEEDPKKKLKLKRELKQLKTRELRALADFNKKQKKLDKLKKNSEPEGKEGSRVQNVEDRIKDAQEEISDLNVDDSEDA